jgi:hypothetical protein
MRAKAFWSANIFVRSPKVTSQKSRSNRFPSRLNSRPPKIRNSMRTSALPPQKDLSNTMNPSRYTAALARTALLVVALCVLDLPPSPRLASAQSVEAALKAEKSFWQSIDTDSIEELKIYLQRYPQGTFVGAAKQRIAVIERGKRDEAEAAERARIEATRPKPQTETVRPTPPAKPNIAGRLFSVGDEIAWTVSDSLTGVIMDDIRLKFDAEQEGIVSASRGLYKFDVFGNRLRTPAFEYDRSYTFLPKDLAVGRKWSHNYQQKNASGRFSSWTWDYEAEALEVVTVPAGQFDTLRIFGTTINRDGQSVRNTFWLERKTMLPVRIQEITRRGSQFVAGTIQELKYFRPADGSAPSSR